MRPTKIAIPLSLALCAVGIALFLKAKPAPSGASEIDFGQPKHPVTAQMLETSAKMSRVDAPSFSMVDVKGTPRQIGGETLSKPQFILFILDTCPCSIDAQPLFNKFSKHWADKVDFLGVIDVDQKKGRAWASDYRAVFPVIPDPKLDVIHAFKAQQSVYSALVSKDGKIVKQWPGYSVDMIADMNREMASEVGETPRKFDAEYAPLEKTSGCFFAK
ncbi:MAG TPA: hypothetical protein VJ835_10105 [Fimbriimonadaceae bacterium]|nr:hypothetical protein [Fimbriimonadaceae bacterium]